MNKKYVNVLALVAMILQTIAVVAGFGMVFMQKTFIPIFVGRAFELDSPVLPTALIFMVLQLVPIAGLSGVHFGKESYIMLVIWIAIGLVFYAKQRKLFTENK